MRLYKRGGTWHYDFTWNGQRVRDTTKQTNKYLAEVVANEAFQKARDLGTDALLRKAPVLETFAIEFLKYVEETQSLGEDAKRYYPNGWRLLKDTPLAKLPMDKITNDDCERLCFPGTTNASANCALRTLRRMLRKAKEMRKLFGEIPTIKERPEWARSIEMSEADALKIDSAWKSIKKSEDSRDAFRVIRSSGMRPSECFKMQWEYVVWTQAVYHNPKGKTRTSRRHVPLNFPPFNCVEILRARHQRMGSPREGWIFPSRTSKSGHLTTINKTFSRARNRAGLSKKMVLYTARHGASTAVAEVTTLKDSMQLMGHSDVETALGYQHPKSKEIAERLWDRMRGNVSVQ